MRGPKEATTYDIFLYSPKKKLFFMPKLDFKPKKGLSSTNKIKSFCIFVLGGGQWEKKQLSRNLHWPLVV